MLAEPSGARTNWAGTSGKHIVPALADYQAFKANVVGAKNGAGHEPGNPVKIAQLILDSVLNEAQVPLHLPLGAFATNAAQEHLTAVLNEVTARRDTSLKADD